MFSMKCAFAVIVICSISGHAYADEHELTEEALVGFKDRLRSIDESLDSIETQLESGTTKVEVTNLPTPAPVPVPSPEPTPTIPVPQSQTYTFKAPVAWCRLLNEDQTVSTSASDRSAWPQDSDRFTTIACDQKEVVKTCNKLGFNTFYNQGFDNPAPPPSRPDTYVWAPFRTIVCARTVAP